MNQQNKCIAEWSSDSSLVKWFNCRNTMEWSSKPDMVQKKMNITTEQVHSVM